MKAYLLDHKEPFLENYIDEIVSLMGHVYPEVVENLPLIKRIVLSEEQRFGATLEQGMQFVQDYLANAKKGDVIPGADVFKLHDTYGFPVEITAEICESAGVGVDMKGFEECMKEQRDRARAANTDDAEAAWSTYGGPAAEVLSEFGKTEFCGYDTLECNSQVIACVVDGKRTNSIKCGQEGHIYTKSTPFYGEMGGQVGDSGVISAGNNEAEVVDTIHPEAGLTAHVVKVIEG